MRFADRAARLAVLRESEIDLVFALEDHARGVSTNLDSPATLQRLLRRVRHEIRVLEILDLELRYRAAVGGRPAAVPEREA